MGENIDAAQALSWVLVDVVMPLDHGVARQASQFASNRPAVPQQQKRLLREWQESDLDTAISNGVNESTAAFATGEPALHGSISSPQVVRS